LDEATRSPSAFPRVLTVANVQVASGFMLATSLSSYENKTPEDWSN
jgi:hypothetical protein